MKYKQKVIPETTNTLQSLPLKQLVATAKELYEKYLQGKTVTNECLGIKVYFSSAGKGKFAFGGTKYAEKVAAIQIMDDLMRFAVYNNFGERKNTDKKNIIGYMNFKAKGKINGVLKHFRISIQFKSDGKFYYNHEINRY